MPIAVVLLHYNRWANLRLALRALREQTLDPSEFHVVVADDGSSDSTVDEMRRLLRSPEWNGRLHFVSGGPHHGARISRIHNVGIANIPLECTFFALMSSDMCFAPDALEQIAHLHEQHPQAVIVTRLDWLPPMTHAEIEAIWDEQGFAGLSAHVPQQPMEWVEQTLVGTETRPLRETAELEPLDSSLFHPVYGVPIELFRGIGGFDEGIVGYGWHELDFGIRLQQQSVLMMTTMQIRALHIWHPKDAAVNDLVPWQRQANTAYVLRKHGPQPLPLNYRNWKYWRHYHRAQGGSVVCLVDGSLVLYAVNQARTHCLQLPHAGWLYPLGFSTGDAAFVHADALTAMANMGLAEDPLDECDFSTLVDDLETRLGERLKAWRSEAGDEAGVKMAMLNQLFAEYDAARTRADVIPGARLPGIGIVIRMAARVIFAGKVWAAQQRVLQATLDEISRLERE